MTPTRRLILVTTALLAAAGCAGAQSEDARFRRALARTPPMVNPSLSRAADAAVSSSWDSTFRMLVYSPAEVWRLVPPRAARAR